MSLEITGTLKQILDPESGTSKAGKEWNKTDFVIETADQYPKLVCFTLFGDKTDLISNIKLGDEVDVSFNLESREYNGKYFHNVNAWKVILKTSGVENNTQANIPPEFQEEPPEPAEGDGGNLPF